MLVTFITFLEFSSLRGSALMAKTQFLSTNTKSNYHAAQVEELYGLLSDLRLS